MAKTDAPRALRALEAFLEAEAPGFSESRALAERAAAISVGYTETRDIAVDAAASVAYLAHFGPRAIVAVSRAISALPSGGDLDHVVDVGAGSGASALAWALAGARRVTLIDRSASALALARRLLAAAAPHCRVETVNASFDAMSTLSDVSHVSAAFVVGELALRPASGSAGGSADDSADDSADNSADEDDVRRCLRTLGRLAPRARAIVVVDAGDRPRARRLQRLRGPVIAEGRAIFGPCGHRDACPALARDRDWCHDRLDKGLPEGLAAFSRRVGRDAQLMSASWLAFGAPGTAADDAGAADDDAIIVTLGEPRVEKGRVRVPICGPRGNRFLQVLKRHTELYRAATSLPRGAHLSASLLPKSTGELLSVAASPALMDALRAASAADDGEGEGDDVDAGDRGSGLDVSAGDRP